MWAQAVAQAGTTNVDAVRQAMYGQKVTAPSGFVSVMNTNHHLSKPVYIGEIRPDGQFNVVWKTRGHPTPPPRSPTRAKSSPWARARRPTTAS